MKKSKSKVRTQSNKKSAKQDEPSVTVYTDLPPDVHGQLRCYLVLSISSFAIRGDDKGFTAVVKWWGEQSQGTYFNTKKLPGIAKYAIKCGPKQFSSYLNDMNKLTVEIVDPNTFRVVANAAVLVKQLSKNNPVRETVQVKDPLSADILGSVNVSLKIMPIPVVFEDRNIPTLDESPQKVVRSPSNRRFSPAKDASPAKNMSPYKDYERQDKENVYPSKSKKDAKITKLISEVLERSRSLKENLVKSQFEQDINLEELKNDISKNIERIPKSAIREVAKESLEDKSINEGDNTVDLYFGKDHIDSVLKKHGLDCSEGESDTSSLHDESLIAHLFYNKEESSDLSSDSEVEEIEFKPKPDPTPDPPTKLHHFNQRPEHDDDVSKALSINKITALGRVNKCKISLAKLNFSKGCSHKGTYFLEYQLPIRDEDHVKTLTVRNTEDEECLTLAHTNIIPVYFDEVLIEQWSIRSISLRLYYKESIENKPLLIADGVIKLSRVFISERFSLQIEHTLHDMEDGNKLGLLEGSLTLADGQLEDVFVSNTPARAEEVVQAPVSPALSILISIPLGKAIQGNSYLIVRLIDSVERLTSEVVWESVHPVYNMKYTVPFTLTSNFIQRLKDNFIIVEVWNKTGVKDKLIGITKLPTNQFYLSLKDSPDLLYTQTTPLVAIDGYMPVVELLNNKRCGMLQVVLALGTSHQLATLSTVHTAATAAEAIPAAVPVSKEPSLTPKVKHTLSIDLQSIEELALFEECVWGQTDCFLKFSVPVTSRGGDSAEMKTFTTQNINCATLMKVGSTFNIVIFLDEATSLPQYLSTHLTDNNVVFELWRRFYYPNLRDQLVAKAPLTLQQVSHLMTLQQGSTQQYQLQFTAVQGALSTVPSMGTLSLSVEYSSEIAQQSVVQSVNHVQLVIGIGRCCGLQYAAQVVLAEGADIEHAATVGVDSYVVVEVSFASLQRETSLRARSFTPSYGSHFSLTLPTVLSDVHSGPPTLAENISKGSVNLSLFHKTDSLRRKGSDVLLAKTSIPLESLLTRQSGIHGWQPLYSLNNKACVAGLEVELGFGDVSDREQVLQDGCSRGWVTPPSHPMVDTEYLTVSLSVDCLWVSDLILQCYKGSKDMCYEERQCYIRVKFYNSDAVCSEPITLHPINIARDRRCRADLAFTHSFPYSVSTNLLWCLREESVEVQVWLLPRGGSTDIGDTIVGCAYLSLANCLSNLAFPATTAQVLPLLKATSPNMGGACLHITGTINKLTQLPSEEVVIEESVVEEEEETVLVEPEGFKFRVQIDKCTNLSFVSEDQALCVYCSVQCSHGNHGNHNEVARTDYRELTSTIDWSFKTEAVIPYECFTGPDNSVTLSLIAHSLETDVDTEIGTVKVDLATLLCGFSYIEGWYCIQRSLSTAVCGDEIIGQMKLSFTPLETVSRHLASVGGATTEPHKVEKPRRNWNNLVQPELETPRVRSASFTESESMRRFGSSTVEQAQCTDIGGVLANLCDVQNMINRIGLKGPTTPAPKPAEPAPKRNWDNLGVRDTSPAESAEKSKRNWDDLAVAHSGTEPEVPVVPEVAEQDVENWLDDVAHNEQAELLGLAEEVNAYSAEVEYELKEEEEEGELMLDTFDITVDTDCLSNFDDISNISDTVTDITQLLKDVKEQSAMLESLEMLEIDTSQLDQSESAECSKALEQHSVDTGTSSDTKSSSTSSDTKTGSSSSDTKTGSSSSDTKTGSSSSDSKSSTDTKSGRSNSEPKSKSGSETYRVKEPVSQSAAYSCPDPISYESSLPNFFMSAKKLSEALVDLKTTGKRPAPRVLEEGTDRISDPSRRPLSSLMRSAPSEDQRARIARIFKH